jgi:Tfp pilus assembly ATPase PilU
MYEMDHLLNLLTAEKAKELQFSAGRPPVIVLEDVEHSLQGPPITSDDLVRLLRSLATSRQMRDLRERGSVQFVYTSVGRAPFVVRAQMEQENVQFSVS